MNNESMTILEMLDTAASIDEGAEMLLNSEHKEIVRNIIGDFLYSIENKRWKTALADLQVARYWFRYYMNQQGTTVLELAQFLTKMEAIIKIKVQYILNQGADPHQVVTWQPETVEEAVKASVKSLPEINVRGVGLA